MKTLIVALMMISGSAHAFEKSSVDSFLSILPIGQYFGTDDHGAECSVKVSEVNYPDKAILITGTNLNNKVSKMVEEGSVFLLKAYKKEFIQTNRYYLDNSKNTYYEKIVRTINAGENLLYVVTALETNLNGRLKIDKIECIVTTKVLF